MLDQRRCVAEVPTIRDPQPVSANTLGQEPVSRHVRLTHERASYGNSRRDSGQREAGRDGAQFEHGAVLDEGRPERPPLYWLPSSVAVVNPPPTPFVDCYRLGEWRPGKRFPEPNRPNPAAPIPFVGASGGAVKPAA